MTPSKSSKRDSRRSSILKPPKPRQPLQSVKLNTSSNKNSPVTPKLKRRVSFAEKKHVKEFCDSVEQGTVWDNTYEEHDLSNIKAPCTSNQGQFPDENDSKENIQTNKAHNEYKDVDFKDTTKDRREDNMQLCTRDEILRGLPNNESCDLNCTNLTESVTPAIVLRTRGEILVNSSPVSLDEVKRNLAISTPKTIYVYEDTNTSIPNAITDQFPQHDASNVSSTELNETSRQDMSMVLTGVITTDRNQPEIEMTSELQNVSMEFTEAVPMAINNFSSNVEMISNAPSIVENGTRSDFDITHHFNNKSLDFTECLASVRAEITHKLEDVQNTEKHNIDRSQVVKDAIQDTSMEFTVPICSVIEPVSNMGNLMPIVTKTFVEDDKTKVFQNASMELTAAVPIVPDIRRVSPCGTAQQFQLNFVEMGDTTSILKTNSRIISFEEESMEITKAIEQTTRLMDRDRESEKTQLLNVPMEMTKPIELHINSMQENVGLNTINSKELHVFTPVNFEKLDSDIQCLKEIMNLDKTKVYIDEPMDFTKAITTSSKLCSGNSELHTCKSDNTENISGRTKIFHTSMTTTAVVPAFSIRDNNKEMTITCNEYTDQHNNTNKTEVFPHTSMEITEVVPGLVLPKTFEQDDNSVNSRRSTTLSYEAPKHTSVSRSISSAINSHPMLNKENCATPYSLNSFTGSSFLKRTPPLGIESSANFTASMALHDDVKQGICASALKDNNTEKACLVTMPVVSPHAATVLHQSKLRQDHENLESAVPPTKKMVIDELQSKQPVLDGASTYTHSELNQTEHPQDHVNAKSMLNTRRMFAKEETAEHPTSNEAPTFVNPELNQNKRLHDHENPENVASSRSRTYTKKFKSMDNVSEVVTLTGSQLNQREYLQEHENPENIASCRRRTYTTNFKSTDNVLEEATLTGSQLKQREYLQGHESPENIASWRRRTYTKNFKCTDNVPEEATLTGSQLSQRKYLQEHENPENVESWRRRTYTKKFKSTENVPEEATLTGSQLSQRKYLQEHENPENVESWRRRTYTKKFKSIENVPEEATLTDLQLNQREYLQERENLESIIPQTGKLFTKEVVPVPSTQTPTSNFSVSNNTALGVPDAENSKVPFVQNNTFYCNTNDKQGRAHSTLKDLETSQTTNNDEYFIDRSVTFFFGSMEELESIKPPSFLGLDDSNTLENTSTKNIGSQEANQISDVIPRELSVQCSESFKLRCNDQDNNLLQDERMNVIHQNITRNSQTSIDQQKILDVNPDDPGIACDNEISVIESRKSQSVSMNCSDMEKQVLNSSSASIINTSERISVLYDTSSSKGINAREVERNNTSIGDQSLNCSSLAARDDCGRTNVCKGDSSPERNQAMEPILKDSLNSTTESCNAINELNKSGGRIECIGVQRQILTDSLESQKDCDEKDSSIDQDPFSSLLSKLKILAQSDDIIWDICHQNIESKKIVFGFIDSSVLIVIFFTNDCNAINELIIKEIKIVSRLEDDADTLWSIVHQILLEKIDKKKLMELYNDHENVTTMLDDISKEVKLAMDFMFDLKRLSDVNLMEITRDRISFLSHTKRLDIILNVTISVKSFDKIETDDINVDCILGSVREEHIKKLIINIKRDHRFLRRFMSDVRDYIYLMEESSSAIK